MPHARFHLQHVDRDKIVWPVRRAGRKHVCQPSCFDLTPSCHLAAAGTYSMSAGMCRRDERRQISRSDSQPTHHHAAPHSCRVTTPRVTSSSILFPSWATISFIAAWGNSVPYFVQELLSFCVRISNYRHWPLPKNKPLASFLPLKKLPKA